MSAEPPTLGKGILGYRKSAVNQIIADRDVMLRQAEGRVRAAESKVGELEGELMAVRDRNTRSEEQLDRLRTQLDALASRMDAAAIAPPAAGSPSDNPSLVETPGDAEQDEAADSEPDVSSEPPHGFFDTPTEDPRVEDPMNEDSPVGDATEDDSIPPDETKADPIYASWGLDDVEDVVEREEVPYPTLVSNQSFGDEEQPPSRDPFDVEASSEAEAPESPDQVQEEEQDQPTYNPYQLSYDAEAFSDQLAELGEPGPPVEFDDPADETPEAPDEGPSVEDPVASETGPSDLPAESAEADPEPPAEEESQVESNDRSFADLQAPIPDEPAHASSLSNGSAESQPPAPPSKDVASRLVTDELAGILGAAEESAARIIERARTTTERQLERSNKLWRDVQSEVERFAEWRAGIEPVIRTVQSKVEGVRSLIEEVPERIRDALAPMAESISSIDGDLSALATACTPPLLLTPSGLEPSEDEEELDWFGGDAPALADDEAGPASVYAGRYGESNSTSGDDLDDPLGSHHGTSSEASGT
jgi:hypothetical protein